MSKLVDRVMDFLGVGEPYDEETEAVYEEKTVSEKSNKPEETLYSRKGNVVSLHTAKQLRVVITEPLSFEESQAIADHLKNRRQVVINLETSDNEVAQRIIDFISGACYALDGHVQKIGEGVFLFVPYNVEIMNETKKPGWYQSPLPWLGLGRDKQA
ncbi:MAG: cell division protein SepF [Syntrophomonadaceae bacterium]|nr:cell division protein SepF [Syntrophomonadaceae bacterium]